MNENFGTSTNKKSLCSTNSKY